MPTLQDLGERVLIRQVIPRFCTIAGDDCAFLNFGNEDLVLTTDPVPQPAAAVIGGDPDLYWAGRLVVTINASDLAAAGAEPVAFLTAIECRADVDLIDFERLLEGVRDGCVHEGLAYAGGNLKESHSFAVTGTAIGKVAHGRGLKRTQAHSGDVLFSVGVGGVFWRDVFRIRSGFDVDKNESPVFCPKSQIRAMQLVRRHIQPTVSMDNSDGLLATLAQLATVNRLQVVLSLDRLTVPHAESLAIEPHRLWLGWGDWNVVIAVPPEQSEEMMSLAAANNFRATEIGEFCEGDADVIVERQGKRLPAPRLESERFAKDSWFSSGIQGYIDLLRAIPLP
jgi:thiamine-monophosphate kinase